MDAYEAMETLKSRISALDPDNASKIMGYILLQDQDDKEMIRLAFGPDAILLSYINRAKAHFGLFPNSPSPNPPTLFPQNPPKILIPSDNCARGFHLRGPMPVPYAANGSGSHYYGGGRCGDFGGEFQLGNNPGCLDPIMSPDGRSDSMVFPYGEDAGPHPNLFHRRSCSENDSVFLSNLEERGCGFLRPCMYFARGFCKKGQSCKFLHGGDELRSLGDNGFGFDELTRMKALQRKQSFGVMGKHHPFAYNRGDLSPLRLSSIVNSAGRSIYLTFPADSTFTEEDVSNYFGLFGPVQDVRLPYPHKRMFGFVTFVYPETVKTILGKGNPHFICDSRVLVKPYKQKGKFKEKKHSQQCLNPSGVDAEHLDILSGPRMLFSRRENMLRRKLEQDAEIQHAIELEGRRMMNLQLMDLNNENQNYRYLQSLPTGIPYSSSRNPHFPMNQHFTSFPDPININQENSEEFDGGQDSSLRVGEKKFPDGSDFFGNMDDSNKLHDFDDYAVHESLLERNLPNNLFASPTRSAHEKNSLQMSSSSCSDDPFLPSSPSP